MRKLISTILATAVLASIAFVPGGAGAEGRCDSSLVVFSRSSQNVGSLNWNAIPCTPGAIFTGMADTMNQAADGPVDFRMINPNSDLIRVRYAADDIPRTPNLIRGKVNGLGFKNEKFFLARSDADLLGNEPSWVYDGPELDLDPQQQGCLKVKAWYSVKKRVKKNGEWVKKRVTIWSAKTTYHTVDTVSC